MNPAVVGAFKSKSVWLGLLVVVLSWAQTTIGDAGLTPDQLGVAGSVLGALIVWLRGLTTKPLAEK
jgi:hypothetical protein